MSHQPDNIFAGTQVVSLVEVRGTNNSLVHPRGAVGVVTRTPTGDQKQFLVRFPDGFEASLTYEQFEVLRHFKDRLGVAADVSRLISTPPDAENQSGLTSAATFDLESFILYRCVVGSRAYGLDNDDSDTDRRGIYLAPAELQWSLFGAPEQFEDNASQSCYWELQKFLAMALKANPNILECLYSPMVEKVTPLGLAAFRALTDLPKEQHAKLEAYLNAESALPIHAHALALAHTYCHYGYLGLSIVQVCVACETVLAQQYREYLLKRGVSNNAIKNNRKDITFSQLLNIHLFSMREISSLPDADTVIGRINWARSHRNDVVHEGSLQEKVTPQEVEDAIAAAQSLTDFLIAVA